MKAWGLLLAAGSSARFGSPKMLASVNGEPLLRRTARVFLESGLDGLTVVLGARAEEIARALEGLTAGSVVNDAWAEGMFSSVCRGLRALPEDIRLVAVSPADLPRLTAAAVRRTLAQARSSGPATLVVPSLGGRLGHPLVFNASLIPRLLSWPSSRRLSDLLSEPDLVVRALPGFDDGVLRDADTPAELAKYAGKEVS